MGGCQNYGPLLGPLNTKCRIIKRTQKGTIVLTTTHILYAILGSFCLGAQAWVPPPDARPSGLSAEGHDFLKATSVLCLKAIEP